MMERITSTYLLTELEERFLSALHADAYEVDMEPDPATDGSDIDDVKDPPVEDARED